MYGGPQGNIQHLYLYGRGHLLRLLYLEIWRRMRDGIMMTCTLNDDSSAQGGDRENCSVGEDTPNMCKDVVIEIELMQS
jgi:hypothetical protein